MRDALNATGRPIVYSMCEWGVSSPWFYGKEVRSLLVQMPRTSHTHFRALTARTAAPGRPHVAHWQGHQHCHRGYLGRRHAGAPLLLLACVGALARLY